MLAAIAAQLTGHHDEASGLLREAIRIGFSEPDILEPEISSAFGTRPDWSALRAAMLANVPPPPARLLTWPTAPAIPYTLFRLPPDREGTLRERIPQPAATAWQTATALTAWVSRRWQHSAEHTEPDALHILDQVDAGARYAAWGHVPYFDGEVTAAGLLVAEATDAYPDFAALGTYSVGTGGRPALRFVPTHPFATGVRVGDTDLNVGDAWEMPLDRPGEHEVTVATRTAYGTLRPSVLRYAVRG